MVGQAIRWKENEVKLDIEFVTGDRSSPIEIESRISQLIPSATLVDHIGSMAFEFVEMMDSEVRKPLLWRHNVQVVVP